MAKKTETFNVTEHVLVPEHELCSEQMKQKIFKQYNVAEHQLPRITLSDPALAHLGVKEGDLIKITRPSLTAGTTVFYRVVTGK